MTKLNERIYNALRKATVPITYRELGVLAGSNHTTVRPSLVKLSKLPDVDIEILTDQAHHSSIRPTTLIFMTTDRPFNEVFKPPLTPTEIIIKVLDDNEYLSLLNIVELSGLDINAPSVSNTIRYIRQTTGRAIERKLVDGEFIYGFNSDLDDCQEDISSLSYRKQYEPVNMIQLLFTGNTDAALAQNKVILQAFV